MTFETGEIQLSVASKSKSESKRMMNLLTSNKTYWSISKSFLNNHFIPKKSFHQNRYITITKYKDKAELFNNVFADQCSLINTSSVLPSVLFKQTEISISSIDFGSDDITKIIQKLDPNKANHGHDMISICMLKICGNSIYKPLQLIFRSCIENREFPPEWTELKKANVVPVYKKGNKQTLENYRPVPLLPIYGKTFDRLMYNSLFEFFHCKRINFL